MNAPASSPSPVIIESAPPSVGDSIPPSILPFGRMEALDAARVLATFGIIWTHVAEGQGQTADVATLGRFGTSFYVIAAALFAVKSAVRNPTRTFRDELGRKLRRLLWPFILWSAIYGAFYGYRAWGTDATWKGLSFWWGPVAGTAVHLWFLPFVFFWGIIASRVVPFLLRRSPLQLVIMGLVVSTAAYWWCYRYLFFALDRPWLWSWHLHRLDRWIVEVPLFITAIFTVALYYKLGDTMQNKLIRNLPKIGITGAVSFIMVQTLYMTQMEWLQKTTESEARFMANLAGFSLLCTFFALNGSSVVRSLAKMGRHTYLAFLCHMLVITLMKPYFQMIPGYGSVPVSLLASLIVLIISVLVSLGIKKTKYLRWLRP